MRRIYRKPKPLEVDKQYRFNHQIKAEELMLIDDQNVHRGVVSLSEALAIAEAAELDLVEVNPTANPPVAKIIDFGQFKYEKDKQAQKQKSKQKKTETKCVRLSVRIGEHDLNFRLDQARKFLEKGNKLKIELILRGRERQHPELAREGVVKFLEQLKQTEGFNIVIEESLTSQNGRFNMLLINKKS